MMLRRQYNTYDSLRCRRRARKQFKGVNFKFLVWVLIYSGYLLVLATASWERLAYLDVNG
jgi:hypothetical protein